MNSFSAVVSNLDALPINVSWQLEAIAEKRGHQELYTRQSPEQLARLREYAMVESAVASNRIEGVEVDGNRIGTIIFGNGIMRDRDEEEVRGYRKALDLIHTASSSLTLSLETICRLHALSRPSIWDSGKFRTKDCEIIQTYEDGSSRVRFKAVAPQQVVAELEDAIEAYENRFAHAGQKRGEKARSVTSVLNETEGKFTVRDIEWKCPGVNKETIKSVLKAHPECFVCEGRGVAARWLKIKNVAE